MGSDEDDILPLVFIKEEPEIIDIYESEHSLTKPNEPCWKVKQEQFEHALSKRNFCGL
jgi:hypothetical protein